jgi:hypothetical protein
MTGGAEHTMLEAAGALLRQGQIIDHLSRLLTVTSLGLLVGGSILVILSPGLAATLVLAILAGIAQIYFAIRVGFDAALFDQLRQPAAVDLAALDAALVQLGLLPAGKSGRPLEQRIVGAQRLFYRQGMALLTQVAILLCAAAAAFIS